MLGAAGLAVAASLNSSGITGNELKGKISAEREDMIKEQMRRVSENRSKNHDQITDKIY